MAPDPTSVTAAPVVTSGGPGITSQVSTEGGGAKSEVAVRVEKILTQLEATTTPEGTVITLPEGVFFDFDRAEVKPEAGPTLEQITDVLKFHVAAPVSIRGHTDSIGSDAHNDDLSRRRALAVRSQLVDRYGIDGSRLEAVGLGKREPAVPNTRPDGSDDPAGREKNRRVEVVIEGVRR